MDSTIEEVINLFNVPTFLIAITTIILVIKASESENSGIPRQPSQVRDIWRNAYMYRLLYGGRDSSIDKLRMNTPTFLNLAQLMRNKRLLHDTRHVCIEEQLSMFLNTVGHKTVNRVQRLDFVRSGETISRYFNDVLRAICQLKDLVICQPGAEVHPLIECNSNWYPFFKDCIGLIDGTHIDANVPSNLQARFRGRKGITQNILAAVTPDKLFTYVLAGWEGAANDFTVLNDALSIPPPEGLKVIRGKYYLCDAGYTTMPGFISPYRSVRYHLKEQEGHVPKNHKELFNLRHSSLRTKIESTFGILKNRFRILSSGLPFHRFPTQVSIVLACCVLHNYIARVDPEDPILNKEFPQEDDSSNLSNTTLEEILDLSQASSRHDQRNARNEWLGIRDNIAHNMWVDYCRRYRGGNCIES